jgi:hypothetical protein
MLSIPATTQSRFLCLLIILPVVLYERETCSLTLSEEHTLMLFENRILRRIFGPRRVEVTDIDRKLHNEEFHNSYFSRSIIIMIKLWRMRWVRHVECIAEKIKVYKTVWWEIQKKRDHQEDQDASG